METIQQDSELMNQHVAAVAVPNSRRFVAVHDKRGQLMLFSLGTDSKLYVSSLDGSGNRVVRDLGLMLGFATTYTGHAFDVVQDGASKLYIAIAIAAGSETSRSSLYLLRPFEPHEADLSSPSFDLKPFIMAGSGSENSRVFEIFMAPAVGENYPPVVFAFKEEVYHSQDLASAAVTKSGDSYLWKKEDNVKLPENAEKIIAVQPLVMKYGSRTIPGHAVLYLIQGKKVITFYSINAPHELQVPLKEASDTALSDPRALAALQDEDGFTDLLVGGNGIYRFKGKELAHPACHKITDTGTFASVKEIHVTRYNSQASLWTTNTDNGIGYLRTDLEFKSPDPPVQVVPDQQGGYFAPFKASPSACEAFVFANNIGNLSLLEQDAKSGVWKTIPLIQPSLSKTTEVQAYMTQIRPLNASGGLLLSHPVILRASGETSVIVNGRSLVATEKGVSVQTDQTGLLTLTVPTDDISSHTFTVTDASSQKSSTATPKLVDPGHKIDEKLSKIKHKEDLDIDLGPGNGKLLDGTKLTPPQIEAVAATIHEAMKARNSIIQSKVPSSMPLESCYGFNAERIIQGSGLPDPKEMVWGAWHWLEKQAEKIESLVVNGAKILVQIGKRMYQWVMKTVDQVGKVLSVIFNKILEIGKKIIQWLGFIFDWKDITATKGSIVNIVKDAMEEGPNLVESLKGKSKHFFDSLKNAVSNNRPTDDELQKLGIKANDSTGPKDMSKNKAGNSMAANWAQYQFNHGGARDASTFLQQYAFGSDTLTAEESSAIRELDKEFQNVTHKYQDKVEARGKALVTEYNPRGKRSVETKYVHGHMEKTFLTDCCDGVEKLVELLLNLVKTIINKFNGVVTTPINVPIFSSLYKKWISPGNELTLLDALAFIIAIPATIIAKLASGKNPPAIEKGRFTTIIKKLANGQSAEDEDFNKFAAITGESTFGISLLLSVPDNFMPSGAEPTSLYDELQVEQSPPTGSLVALISADFSGASAEGGKVTFEHFLDASLFIYTLNSIPTKKENPGYTLRIIGWIASVLNSTINITLHFVTALTTLVVDKVRAVLNAILGAIVFALSVAASALEIKKPGWKGKDDTASGLDIATYTFILVGGWSGALERFVKEAQPEIALVAMIAKYISYGLAVVMVGTKVGIHIAHGNWTDLPFAGSI